MVIALSILGFFVACVFVSILIYGILYKLLDSNLDMYWFWGACAVLGAIASAWLGMGFTIGLIMGGFGSLLATVCMLIYSAISGQRSLF